MRLTILLLVAGLFCSFCAVRARTENQAASSGTDALIRPGQTLELFAAEDSSFNGRYQVRRGGYIILPAVGRILVAGMTAAKAEKAVAKALEATQMKNATVMIDLLYPGHGLPSGNFPNQDNHRVCVYVTGRVAHPGAFPFTSDHPPGAYAEILAAGGFARFADIRNVFVLRGSPGGLKERISVNVFGIVQFGKEDVPLHAGDIVVVPEKFFSSPPP